MFIENNYFDGKNPFMLAYEVKDEIDPIGTTIKAIGNVFASTVTKSDSSTNGLALKANGIYVLTASGSNKAYSSDLTATRTTTSVGSICNPLGNSTSYANFDTNSELFYFDDTTHASKVTNLTDASNAKTECETYSGAGYSWAGSNN